MSENLIPNHGGDPQVTPEQLREDAAYFDGIYERWLMERGKQRSSVNFVEFRRELTSGAWRP